MKIQISQIKINIRELRKAYLTNTYDINKKGLETLIKKVKIRANSDHEGEKNNEKN